MKQNHSTELLAISFHEPNIRVTRNTTANHLSCFASNFVLLLLDAWKYWRWVSAWFLQITVSILGYVGKMSRALRDLRIWFCSRPGCFHDVDIAFMRVDLVLVEVVTHSFKVYYKPRMMRMIIRMATRSSQVANPPIGWRAVECHSLIEKGILPGVGLFRFVRGAWYKLSMMSWTRQTSIILASS